MIGVYKFTNKYNRKVYIGKSKCIEKRLGQHKRNARKGVKGYFYNALRKYGIDGFDFEVLIECPVENLNYWEKFYIKYYCSNISEYGYNKTSGGDGAALFGEDNGMFNRNHSEESKKKMKDHYVYHTYERTEEHKKLMGELTKGNKSFTGHNHSTKTKKQMSVAATEAWKTRPRHWYKDKETNKRIYY